MRIDVCTDNKGNDIEERNPGLLGQKLLGKCQRQWRRDPAHFHNGHEAGSNGGSDLVKSPRTCNDRHRREVYCVLNWRYLHDIVMLASLIASTTHVPSTYNQVADKDLQYLCFQARPAREKPL